MEVERNVLGSTSFAGAMGGIQHRHDRFTCPHIGTKWHKKIVAFKFQVYTAIINDAIDKNRIKRIAAKKIKKILKANT